MPYVDLEAGLVDPNDQTAATTIITTTTTTSGAWIIVGGGGEEEDDLVAIVASLGSLTLVGVLLIVALLLRK